MGVPCPNCGRQYDVALFSFGRTIHCTCGRRVGLEARVRFEDPGGAPRFIADAMLGRLARWLRLLGFDTVFDERISDAELARRSLQEQRVILTRDRALPEEWRLARVHLVEGEAAFDQLREVVGAFDLAEGIRLFTRCSRCNAPLEAVSPEEVRCDVPPRIFDTRDAFQRCPACTRVYWEGSHTERVQRVVARVLADA